jgi:hypothetical protein
MAFIEPEDSMPPSQVPATDLQLEPDKSIHIPPFYLLKTHLMLALLPLTVDTLAPSRRALYSAVLLNMITIIMFGDN